MIKQSRESRAEQRRVAAHAQRYDQIRHHGLASSDGEEAQKIIIESLLRGYGLVGSYSDHLR
jgi:hypothetical protein